MDPNIHFEQPGLAEDHGPGEETAAYLRRLKAEHMEDAPRARADVDTRTPATQSSPAVKERRQTQRFACSGSVEFKTEGSDVRMWGTVTDISLHGCYLEMSTTFPVNTKASLVIESAGVRVHTQATVRASYPFLGMGMSFTGIEAGQRSRLEEILAALAGQRTIVNDVPSEEPSLAEVVTSADPWACTEEIAEFFKKNAALSRDQFYEIANRVRRS